MKSTELNLIPIFVAIYEERSLSKAASRMSISQPAVSKALARLRDIYDEPLFHRTTSGVDPTAFASDIYPAMAAALKNFTSTLSDSRDFDPKTSNRVFSIACVSAASYELLPKVMALISDVAPTIALEVHPLFTEDYESDLRLQRHDLVIDMTPRGRTLLKHEPISTEELMVVCREDHPRLGDSISMEQFLHEGHVVVSRWHSRKSLLSSEDYADLEKRNIVYRAAGVVEMLPVIESSNYIGVMPLSSVKCFAKKYQVKTLALPFELPNLDLCMVWHPSRTNEPSHKWLRDKVKLAVKNISNPQ
ncbi:LysR family transcriptional regulator [Vibrio sp. 10N.261.55.A7]|uniref:LysR family transcriptional regulator n=1 Tax=Vibrio sp. 10N.261.55.A7 TaxID=1880851 RepID=UPI000C826F9A|nr:LysR family transcriptional regulator [Vibrio sp. 10N.261.55.A7]PMK01154.1 LysR family transcriptional regulator [Vibrio sp. 10N.261.55.A7]